MQWHTPFGHWKIGVFFFLCVYVGFAKIEPIIHFSCARTSLSHIVKLYFSAVSVAEYVLKTLSLIA